MDKIKRLIFSKDAGRFIRFCVTGCLNTGVDFVVFTLLTTGFHVNMYWAQVVSYSAGMINSYCINRSWTFQSKSRFFSGELLRFLLVNLTVLALSVGVLYGFHQLLRFHYLLAKLFTVGFTLVFGFLLNRWIVFRSKA